ncbi:MAG: signal peptidase I [Candidatus Nanopelagicales bacterium]|nr:signal peptidase I [Candidatus Nanopelagicales bacterium]
MAKSRRGAWWDLPLTFVIAFGVVLLLTTFGASPFSIPSGSMEDTLQVGDRVLVNKITYRLRPIERGDVVVFDGTDSFVEAGEIPKRDPITGALSSLGQSIGVVPPDSTDFVKRVIGVAGDHVVCCDGEGRITVNDAPLDEASYTFPSDSPSDMNFDVIVSEGKLWLMGDHRSNSADSRYHLGDPGGGMVPQSRVVGRVMSVLWPLNRIQSIPIPETFAQVTAPSTAN